MRKSFAAVLLVGAFSATPALAETMPGGSISGSASTAEFDSTDQQTYELEGSYAFGFSGNWGAQGDITLTRVEADVLEEDVVGLTGHVFHRDERYLFGGFVGFRKADVEGVDTPRLTTVGLNFAGYQESSIISARGGYTTAEDSDATITSLEGRGQFFVTDNFYYAAGVGLQNIDPDLPLADQFTTLSVGVDGEYRFAAFPGSVFGSASYTNIEGEEEDAVAFQIGFTFDFGSATLRAREESGASLRSAAESLSGVR